MTKEEISRLLVRASAIDNRQVTPLAIEAWWEVLEQVDYGDAVEALRRFRQASDAWLQPAHIMAGVRALWSEHARARRIAASREPAPLIPLSTKPPNWREMYEAARRGVDPNG
ncbi:hypothetical protein [Lysinibacter sp. HNR]|uniref:hypothetical protein n=1 Tax=Lysinibacter sp. HNR TaxID=3031408 RepID=UPI002435FCF4|nr:hypothetical protein [Lysinibacter sp. HNR]WGD36824.1 hypothetical protein FrondiHNR_10235 [Lysinibacter sp. HNR]